MKYQVDARFDQRIWKAHQEIVNAFAELTADVSKEKLTVNINTNDMEKLYKRKANQAKALLSNCIDSQIKQYEVIPQEFPVI